MTNGLIGIGTGKVGEPIGTGDGVEVMTPTTRGRVQKEALGIPIRIDQDVTAVAPEKEIREAIIVAAMLMDMARQRPMRIPTRVDPQETVLRLVKLTFQKMMGPEHGVVLLEASTIVGGRLVEDQEGTRNSTCMNGAEENTNNHRASHVAVIAIPILKAHLMLNRHSSWDTT